MTKNPVAIKETPAQKLCAEISSKLATIDAETAQARTEAEAAAAQAEDLEMKAAEAEVMVEVGDMKVKDARALRELARTAADKATQLIAEADRKGQARGILEKRLENAQQQADGEMREQFRAALAAPLQRKAEAMVADAEASEEALAIILQAQRHGIIFPACDLPKQTLKQAQGWIEAYKPLIQPQA